MFLYREQDEQRQMSRSEDFFAEQGTRFIAEEQPGQDIEDFRIPRRKRKSLASSSVSVIGWISLCSE